MKTSHLAAAFLTKIDNKAFQLHQIILCRNRGSSCNVALDFQQRLLQEKNLDGEKIIMCIFCLTVR